MKVSESAVCYTTTSLEANIQPKPDGKAGVIAGAIIGPILGLVCCSCCVWILVVVFIVIVFRKSEAHPFNIQYATSCQPVVTSSQVQFYPNNATTLQNYEQQPIPAFNVESPNNNPEQIYKSSYVM